MRVKVPAGLFAAVCLAQACCLSPASGRELTWDELRGRFEPPAWFGEARFGIWLHWGLRRSPSRAGAGTPGTCICRIPVPKHGERRLIPIIAKRMGILPGRGSRMSSMNGRRKNWLRRHQELVSKYDVDMLWFDGWGFPYGEYGKKLCAYYYNRRLRQGKVTGLVVGKFANEPSTARDIECGGANSILPRVWQGTITPAGWFYKKYQPLRHSARTIIEMLADMNSKNGNMLLNVELQSDGTIPPERKKMLDEIGAWVNLNGEAIYGSKPWKVYGDNLNSIVAELKNKKNPSETDLAMLKKLGSASEQFNERTVSSPPYGHQEVRFTTRDGFLYAFVLNPREGEVKLPSLGYRSAHNDRHIASVEMLGGKGKVPFRQTEEALAFDVPAERPNPYACVFKIKFR